MQKYIMLNNYYKGLLAEKLALIYLKINNHKIVKHRYKNKCGEIDIISLHKRQLHFIEVKSRKNHEFFLDVLNKKQQKRIKNSALCFLQANPNFVDYKFSFDVIFISFPFYFTYIHNSF